VHVSPGPLWFHFQRHCNLAVPPSSDHNRPSQGIRTSKHRDPNQVPPTHYVPEDTRLLQIPIGKCDTGAQGHSRQCNGESNSRRQQLTRRQKHTPLLPWSVLTKRDISHGHHHHPRKSPHQTAKQGDQTITESGRLCEVHTACCRLRALQSWGGGLSTILRRTRLPSDGTRTQASPNPGRLQRPPPDSPIVGPTNEWSVVPLVTKHHHPITTPRPKRTQPC